MFSAPCITSVHFTFRFNMNSFSFYIITSIRIAPLLNVIFASLFIPCILLSASFSRLMFSLAASGKMNPLSTCLLPFELCYLFYFLFISLLFILASLIHIYHLYLHCKHFLLYGFTSWYVSFKGQG